MYMYDTAIKNKWAC